METYKEFQKKRRKCQRQELKVIESHLHPQPPKLNNCQILHEHKGRQVIFTAWRGDEKANDKLLMYPRQAILNNKCFYNLHLDSFRWLCSEA